MLIFIAVLLLKIILPSSSVTPLYLSVSSITLYAHFFWPLKNYICSSEFWVFLSAPSTHSSERSHHFLRLSLPPPRQWPMSPALSSTWVLKMLTSNCLCTSPLGYCIDSWASNFLKLNLQKCFSSSFPYFSEWYYPVFICSSLKHRHQSWVLFLLFQSISNQLLKYLLNHPLSPSFLLYCGWTPDNISHRFLQQLLYGLPVHAGPSPICFPDCRKLLLSKHANLITSLPNFPANVFPQHEF